MRKNSGMSVMQVVVIMSMVSVVTVAILKTMDIFFKSSTKLSRRNDVEGIKREIIRRISCEKTLPVVPPPGGCTPGNFIPLKDKNDAIMTGPLEPSGNFAGSGQMGQWMVRTTCDQTNGTLEVRFANRQGNSFGADPMTKQPLDFSDNSVNPVFGPITGPKPGVTICGDRFAPPSATCPDGTIIGKVNFDTNTTNCVPINSPVSVTNILKNICYCLQMICWNGSSYDYGGVVCARFGTWTPQAMCPGGDDDSRMLLYQCPP